MVTKAKESEDAPAELPTPTLPKVLQCTDVESPYFGYVATVGIGRSADLYFVGSGEHGGGWETAEFVKDWTELVVPQ